MLENNPKNQKKVINKKKRVENHKNSAKNKGL
ncbi:hypothetical protein LMT8_03860 [Leuconostoc mesenteroides subsp. cremoris TIFN8]|nr:hypothetical protein LMT8_03860 [Leuconostoc mesenteroides subsp. cremoris TIFN8]